MAELTLVIANKSYSSWSLRGWLALKHTGAQFREIMVLLDKPDTRQRILRFSPAGRVPVLIDGDLAVWDSLAICEYLAEKFPACHGWPENPAARAQARSIAAEMHSGFVALRTELPMNCRGRRTGVVPSAAARADIARITSIWENCRARYGAGGPWLFGRFSFADAMYAPVAFRLYCYGVVLQGAAATYQQAVFAHPAVREWVAAAKAETEIVPSDEAGTPIPD
jgi:glutathione S-transferase